MSLRSRHLLSHPDFPWLDPTRPDELARWAGERGWVHPGERIISLARAGEGNMNLTLRLTTDRRTLILKQARPWVEKYDHIEAPWERILFEQRFYARVATIPEVSRLMPRLLGCDADARVLLLEDLADASDYSDLYTGGEITPGELAELARWLRALHDATALASGTPPDPAFSNRAMRDLNHRHIHLIPLAGVGGPDLDDLDAIEPGLAAAATSLRADPEYAAHVTRAGERYLADGRCLLHGDFFPGSWLRTPSGPRVIDPEFGFYGDPEFDLACAVAHLALARKPAELTFGFIDTYGPGPRADVLARDAATEVMRRLIGVAQLPLPCGSVGSGGSVGFSGTPNRFRAVLLENSRRAMLTGTLDPLFESPAP